jgi:hypothetical protein
MTSCPRSTTHDWSDRDESRRRSRIFGTKPSRTSGLSQGIDLMAFVVSLSIGKCSKLGSWDPNCGMRLAKRGLHKGFLMTVFALAKRWPLRVV